MTRDQAITTLREIVAHYQPVATDVDTTFRHLDKGTRQYAQAVEAAKVVTAAISALDHLGALEEQQEKKKGGFAVAGM